MFNLTGFNLLKTNSNINEICVICHVTFTSYQFNFSADTNSGYRIGL